MPPTFLLVAAIIGISFLAPFVAIVAVLALASPRMRPLGVKVIVAGGAGAAGCLTLELILNLMLGDVPEIDGVLITAGFGFVSVGLGWPIWRWLRAPLPTIPPSAPQRSEVVERER
jgi:hypothetical protein